MNTLRVAVVAALILVGSSSPGRPLQAKPQDQSFPGIPLPGIIAAEAKTLEIGLKTNPDNLSSREKLIQYCFIANIKLRDFALEEKREEHVFWLIEHHPESYLAGSPEAEIMPGLSSRTTEAYQHGKQLWADQVAKNSDSPVVLLNASDFMFLSDRDRSRELLEKVLLINPQNKMASSRLAQSYEMEREASKSSQENEALSQKALFIRERGLQNANSEQRFDSLGDPATAAFEAGDIPKAEQYTRELVQMAPHYKQSWNYGNAIHKGNIVLGRIALRRGDIPSAKQHLLAAGETPGSPPLDSFGPNMTLPKELLEKNEREAVLTYFESCAKFWKVGGKDLKNWAAMIKGGGMPDFGANLVY
jgi:tetratricopeptide (TPR) repeat protein